MDKTSLSGTSTKHPHALPLKYKGWEALNALFWEESLSHSWDLDIWMDSVYG